MPVVGTQPPLSLPMMLQLVADIRHCMPNEIVESKLPLTSSVSKLTAEAVGRAEREDAAERQRERRRA